MGASLWISVFLPRIIIEIDTLEVSQIATFSWWRLFCRWLLLIFFLVLVVLIFLTALCVSTSFILILLIHHVIVLLSAFFIFSHNCNSEIITLCLFVKSSLKLHLLCMNTPTSDCTLAK